MGIELTDNDVKDVSGGSVEYSRKLHAYLVKDDKTDNVLASVYDKKEAEKMDRRLNLH